MSIKRISDSHFRLLEYNKRTVNTITNDNIKQVIASLVKTNGQTLSYAYKRSIFNTIKKTLPATITVKASKVLTRNENSDLDAMSRSRINKNKPPFKILFEFAIQILTHNHSISSNFKITTNTMIACTLMLVTENITKNDVMNMTFQNIVELVNRGSTIVRNISKAALRLDQRYKKLLMFVIDIYVQTSKRDSINYYSLSYNPDKLYLETDKLINIGNDSINKKIVNLILQVNAATLSPTEEPIDPSSMSFGLRPLGKLDKNILFIYYARRIKNTTMPQQAQPPLQQQPPSPQRPQSPLPQSNTPQPMDTDTSLNTSNSEFYQLLGTLDI